MPKVYPLFSGSKGNCYYVSSGESGILIDAGRSAKQIETALKAHNIDISSNIKGMFITHEHSDHISGVRVFASRYGINVYSTESTLQAMWDKNLLVPEKFNSYVINDGANVGNMVVKPFKVSHDVSCVGYTVEVDNKKVAFATDTGVITSGMKKALNKCNLVVIESNHDVNMLLNGVYPYELKRRVLSERGHLSNETCAEYLPTLVENGTTHILLAHLSQENNMPQLALQTAVSSLSLRGMTQNKDYKIATAKPVADGEVISF